MLKYINGWTKEKVIKHIKDNFKERAVSLTENGVVNGYVYLDKHGNKCAVGLFIPEGHSGQNYIGCVSSLLEKYPDLKEKMPMESIYLEKFQNIHDLSDGKNTKQELIDYIEKYS